MGFFDTDTTDASTKPASGGFFDIPTLVSQAVKNTIKPTVLVPGDTPGPWALPSSIKSAVNSLPSKESITGKSAGSSFDLSFLKDNEMFKQIKDTLGPIFKSGIKEQVDKIPTPIQPKQTVRNQDFIDVLNVLPIIAGNLVSPAISAGMSLAEVVANKPLGNLAVPSIGNRGNIINAQGSRQFFYDQLAAGVDEKKAFWNSALKTVGDLSVLVPLAQDVGRFALLRTNPESLISREKVTIAKEDLHDYLTGRETKNNIKLPQELKESIADTLKNGTREEKTRLIHSGETSIEQVKPSRLGRLVGISNDEAKAILKSINETPAPESNPAPTLALSGPNVKEELQNVADQFKSKSVSNETTPIKSESKYHTQETYHIQQLTEKGSPDTQRQVEFSTNKQTGKTKVYTYFTDANGKQSGVGDIMDLSDAQKKFGTTNQSELAQRMINGRYNNATDSWEIIKPNKEVQGSFNVKSRPTGTRISLKERPVEVARVEEYRKRLKLRGADPVIVDAIITPKGERAYGVSVGGTLSFEKVVQEFTEDHEVFHQVFQNLEKMRLFKDFDKKALLDEARNLYGNLPDNQLEEEMASDFQEYVKEKEAGKSSSFFGKVKDFFDRLWSSFKRLFTKGKQDIEEFYRTVHEGKAAEETNIESELPPSFNKQAREGVIDFRETNDATQKFLKETPAENVFNDDGDLTLKTLTKLHGRATVSKQFIMDLTNSGDIKQVERDLIRANLKDEGNTINVQEFADKIKAELLPLKIKTQSGTGKEVGYENISLPDDIRGNVANYSEHIYESPIKTFAGQIHFPGDSENYFGHTRIEDMAGPTTNTRKPHKMVFNKRTGLKMPHSEGDIRRIIEIQSDLYQKGNLDREIEKDLVDQTREGNIQDFSKLQQYNNPTAHFRMVREEIRKAAQDGKTKLQFPTGETAMKIEGLGENIQWSSSPKHGNYAIDEEWIKDRGVGTEIYQGDEPWIITDILDDGKFKAVPKDVIESMKSGSWVHKDGTDMKNTKEDIVKWISENNSTMQETFDISGKIDKNNPIYRFYEKDLGRYLKNNYGAKPITDDKGVTWYQMQVDPREANVPVPAFNKHPDNIPELRKELEKAQGHLDMAVSNQEIFGDKIPELKAKVDELRKQIAEAKNPVADNAREVLANAEKRVGLQRQLERTQLSLNAAKEMPEAHEKAYGENRIPQYEEKIASLEKRIKELPPELKAPGIRVLGKNIEIPEELVNRQIEISMDRERLNQNPAQQLSKFTAKSGEFKGELPEVTGKVGKSVSRIKNSDTLNWITNGDDIATELGFKDSEDARGAWNEYVAEKQDFKTKSTAFKKDLNKFILSEKDKIALARISERQGLESEKAISKEEEIQQKKEEAESVSNWKSIIQAYAEEQSLPQSLNEVIPPKVRGGIQSPELDFSKWKDKAIIKLNRDTFERNLEKVAPPSDAQKLKDFIVNPVRENELDRVEFNNALRTEIRDLLKELDIKRNSIEDELIQKFGENLITIGELQAASPKKWSEIQQASNYFRNQYDMLIDKWNAVRKQFGYPQIPRRKDYFRHFDEINFFTKTYGFLRSQDELPTEIAGKTEFFKPGKPFSTAELKRTGNSTSYSAIGGMNNYIDSVSKQIFHIDSIQRGRALERYLERSAQTAQRLGEPLKLSNTIANIREYINSGLAGKTATLDRVIENTIGRPALRAFHSISKLIGKNIIVGNISTALSHLVSLPLIAATTEKLPFMKGALTTLTSPISSEGFNMIDGQKSSFLTRRFPIEEIMPTMPKSIEQALSYLFITTDKFKSRLAVSAKYYQNIQNGMDPEKAMREADIYAGKVLGDYSIGQKPNLMNTKTTSLLAQFQLGLNDSMSVLLHDIPEGAKTYTQESDGSYKSETKKWTIISQLIQFAMFSYLFNLMLKQIRGSGKGIDPIDLALTLLGENEEGQGQSLQTRLSLAGKDLAGELPFTSAFTGNFPLATALTQPLKDLTAGNYKKMAEGILADFASPVGGGLQIKKAFEGLSAYNKGYVANTAGVPKFPIKHSVGNAARAIIFGPNATPTAQTYYSSKGQKNPMQSTYDEVQALVKEGKVDEATKITEAMTPAQYKQYKDLKASIKAQETKKAEVDIIPTTQKVQALVSAGKIDEATAITKAMTPAQYKAYQGAKKLLATANKKTQNTFGSSPTEWDKQSFLTHVVNIAKATVIHPIEYFNAIFDGAGDWRVVGQKGNQIIVNRMPESASEAIKRSEGKDTSDWKLDHIQPLEAGGLNNKNNLQLIPTAQWATNTAVENLIADKLLNGEITGAQAKELSIRYKAGQGEILSPAFMEIYKNKYKSTPISQQEIENY